ncbi:MAG: vitamin K epoxide reductase family protein [Chlamydiales bacterium]|nr:vitamin K epoxide reductase family protein [Chlamydiales bacterium]
MAEITVEERNKIQREFHNKMIWTRFGMIVLGLWLLMSPESFGYIHEPLRYSDWISGLLLVIFGFISMKQKWSGWIWGGCLVGIWLQFAPLAFWAEEPVIYVNDTLIGILAIAFTVLVPLRPYQFEIGPQIPPGWTYNPSSWPQRIPIIFFAIVGWFIARYMAAFQLHYIDYVWDPFFGMGTERVITSMISHEFPVPDAGLGAMAYSLEAIMGAKGGARRWHTMPWIVVVFGILVVPLGFVSITLVMLQPIAVGAWCGLCLIIATCMLIMLALTVDEVVAVCQYLRQVRREKKPFRRIFFKGSEYSVDSVDTRSPSFSESPWKIIKSMFWGVRIQWNLLITALIGAWLLFANNVLGYSGILADNTDVCGALIVVFSIIAWAEVTRAVRFMNMIIALWFAVASFVLPGATDLLIWHSVIVGAVVIILSIFRGRIKEKYGNWDRLIF